MVAYILGTLLFLAVWLGYRAYLDIKRLRQTLHKTKHAQQAQQPENLVYDAESNTYIPRKKNNHD